MTRERWFCCLCGALVARDPGENGALCRAHSNLRVDEVPPDPLESLTMHAGDLTYSEAAIAAREREGC